MCDSVEPGVSGGLPARVLDRPDFDPASRVVPPVVAHSKPSPPVSLRLALLIALVCLALSILPTLARLPRRLEDHAWSRRKRASRTGHAHVLFAAQLEGNLGLSRAPPAQQTLKEFPSPALRSHGSAAARLKDPQLPSAVRATHPRVRRAFAKAPAALPASVVRPVRPRRAFAATTRVRVRAFHSFLYEFRDDIVLAVVLAMTIGLLAALYAS
ncbi:hypothetical protein BH18ACT14_BH18ACT14_10500 [soil metagenome]